MGSKGTVNVMSAVTAIINPLDRLSVLLFRCNDKSQLVIEERPANGGDYVAVTDNGCVEGNLKSEVGATDLAVVVRESMVCICPFRERESIRAMLMQGNKGHRLRYH